VSRLGGKAGLKGHAKRLGGKLVGKYGNQVVDAAAAKAKELSDKHVPGFAQPLAHMAINAAAKKGKGAVAKYGTAGLRDIMNRHPSLPNGSVRQAIERHRDFGQSIKGSAGFKLGHSLTPHGGVPHHGVAYR
jgi:hypothetical protein